MVDKNGWKGKIQLISNILHKYWNVWAPKISARIFVLKKTHKAQNKAQIEEQEKEEKN